MKIFSNFISNLLWQISAVIFGFVIPPLIIAQYGSSANGLVATFKQLINCLNVFEGGVGAAAVALLYQYVAMSDYDKQSCIMSNVQRLYINIAMIFSGAIAVIAVYLFFYSPAAVDDAWLVLIVMACGTCIDYALSAKYKVYLVAIGKNAICSNVMAISTIINILLYLLFIKKHVGLAIVQLSIVICALVRFVVFWQVFSFQFKTISWSCIQRIKIEQSTDVLAHQICGLIVFNSPIIIVSIFCGLEDASVFSIYFLIFGSISMLLSTLSNGVQALLGVSWVKDKENTKVNFIQFEVLYLAVTFCVYTVALVLVDKFVELYTDGFDGSSYQRPELALLFIIVGLLDNIRVPGRTLISAVGHYKLTKSRTVAEAIINIGFSLLLGYAYGMSGVLFGAVLSFMYRDIDIFFYVYHNVLNLGFKRVGFRLLSLVAPFLIVLVASMEVGFYIDGSGWIGWFLNACLTMVAVGAIYALIYWCILKKLSESEKVNYA